MRGITVYQPYAHLLAVGAKQFETRPMATKYRGPLAIHAGKSLRGMRINTLPQDANDEWRKRRNAVSREFTTRGIHEHAYGAIIAYADLVECYRCEDLQVSERERLFGDWTPGRYAWEIANVRMLDTPIPYKGQLGLWNVKPDMIEGAK